MSKKKISFPPVSTKHTTKCARLLYEMERRGGMTSAEIQQFIYEMNNGMGKRYCHKKDQWGYLLYGNRERTGILERFCEKNFLGEYYVVREIYPPFTTKRRYS